MTRAAAHLQPDATLDEDAWDDLLSFIEERRVVPIVGPELLTVATDEGSRLLHDWVAERLAARLDVDTRQLPRPYTLNDVVCWLLAARGRREEAYVRLRGLLKDAQFEPPAALRQLAAITDFDLFVSTTFDSLLETAINLERFGGADSIDMLAYAPNRVTDLPAERDRMQRPVVYHPFGKLSASPTYGIPPHGASRASRWEHGSLRTRRTSIDCPEILEALSRHERPARCERLAATADIRRNS